MLEGGGHVNGSLLSAQLVDETSIQIVEITDELKHLQPHLKLLLIFLKNLQHI